MKKVLIGIGVVVVIIIIILLAGIGTYNSLATGRQEIDNQWGQVENVYQRRYDLIPNLVKSVEGAMAQEKAIFGAIAEARTKYGDATTMDEKVAAANELETAVGRLLVIMENYPELKSIDTVSSLMAELAGTENRIAIERRRYNEEVLGYNKMVVTVPSNIIASIFGFEEKPYFEAEEGANEPPEVKF